MQAKMMQMINRLQTTNQPTGTSTGGARAGRRPAGRSCSRPDRQQVVPGVKPRARGDLVDLIRSTTTWAAMGVPASVIFGGFANLSQLQP